MRNKFLFFTNDIVSLNKVINANYRNNFKNNLNKLN